MTTVVHVNKSAYDIYIGRANGSLPESKWANRHVIGKDGTREECVAKYEIDTRANKELMAALPELRNQRLGCWCKDENGGGQLCHGDILVKLLRELDGPVPKPVVSKPEILPPVIPKRDILPLFSTHYCYGNSNLTLEEAGKTKPGNPASIIDIALEAGLKQVTLVEDRMDGLPEAQKNLSKAGMQLIFGLKLTVVPDMADKTPASEVNESSVIVFMKDVVPPKGVISPSYIDLIKIHNLAWTVGRHGEGRIDWANLKRLWTPNLVLALPFFSSFLSRNLLTMATIIPDLPAVPWVFKEVDSQIPFAPLIEKAIDQYAVGNQIRVQEVKSIYYRNAASFKDYTVFRARSTRSKGKSGTFSAPGVDNLSSDQFSMEAWRKLVS